MKNEHNGTFVDWHLKLWGESIDASKATLLPLPSVDDDAEHDVISSTVTPPVATATVATVTTKPEATHDDTVAKPTDHPERPTKAGPKPTGTETSTDVAQETTSTPTSWISKFPTFGASKTAQIWIYGALGLIVAFCIGLGIYLFVARRRRLRNNSRNNYDFEVIDDEEERDALKSGEKGAAGGKTGRRTRGGELYDAFAGGSDDDDEFDEYRDRSAERLDGVLEEDRYEVGEESDDEGDDEKAESKPLGGRG